MAAAAILVSATTMSHAAERERGMVRKWDPWAETSGYISNEDTRGEVGLFAPLWQSDSALLFGDIRGKLFESDIHEGNFAVGLRALRPSGWNLGLWAGWDTRRTEHHSTFNQVSVGVEALRASFDFRLNGYMPTNDTAHVATTVATRTRAPFAELVGNQLSVVTGGDTIVTTRAFDLALYGADGEIGFRVPLHRLAGRRVGPSTSPAASEIDRHELRLFAGAYYFDHDDFDGEIAGPRVRGEWRINDVLPRIPGSRLTMEAGYRYDDVRESQWEVGVRFRLPFGGGERRRAEVALLSPQERRMTERLERDTDVVTAQSTTTTTVVTPLRREKAVDALTGVRFDQVAYGDGATSLEAAAAVGPNTLIIAQGGGEVIDLSPANGLTLQPNQTIVGGGTTLPVRGMITGSIVPFTAPGEAPTLLNVGNSPILTVTRNTHVAGLTLVGGGQFAGLANHGILLPHQVDNVLIENTSITDIGGDGVRGGNASRGISIRNTTVSNAAMFGIRFGNDNADIEIEGSIIAGANMMGIQFGDRNAGIAIDDVGISSTFLGGIEFRDGNSDIVLSNLDLSRPGTRGISFRDDNSDVSVVDGRISDTGLFGVQFRHGNARVQVARVSISNSELQSIDFGDVNIGLSLTENMLESGLGDAFSFGSGNEGDVSRNMVEGIFGSDIAEFGGGNQIRGSENVVNASFRSLCNSLAPNTALQIAFTRGAGCY